jgi:hypothetical protein
LGVGRETLTAYLVSCAIYASCKMWTNRFRELRNTFGYNPRSIFADMPVENCLELCLQSGMNRLTYHLPPRLVRSRRVSNRAVQVAELDAAMPCTAASTRLSCRHLCWHRRSEAPSDHATAYSQARPLDTVGKMLRRRVDAKSETP